VNVFNPSLVVLGSMFGRMHSYISAQIERALDRDAMAAPREMIRVVPAALGADAPLLGAAELAFEPLLVDPAGWLAPRPALVRVAGA
jgi:predicted NBD/HSP70 family sugar kinase